MKETNRKELYRKRARRKNFFKRVFFIFLCILILFLILSKIGFFNVASIKVYGNDTVETSEIINRSGLKPGENFFSISKSKRIDAINSIARIKSSDISFSPMGTTKINVVERKAVLQIENYTNYYIIDEELRIIDILNKPIQNIKELSGVKLDNYDLGDYLYFKDKNKKDFILRLFKNEEIFSTVESIYFSKDGLNLKTYDGITIELGDANDSEYKLDMLREILKDIKSTNKDVDKIDMTRGDNPIVVLENIYNPTDLDQDANQTNNSEKLGN